MEEFHAETSRDEKIIYICSPLRAATKELMEMNAERARAYVDWASKKYGCRAVAPHASFPVLLNDDYPYQRQIALDFGKKLLSICSMVIVCGPTVSEGMAGEIELANTLGIPVEYVQEPDIDYYNAERVVRLDGHAIHTILGALSSLAESLEDESKWAEAGRHEDLAESDRDEISYIESLQEKLGQSCNAFWR